MAEAKELVYDPSLMALLDGEGEQIDTEFDPDADYNRPAPPVEDGWYYGKASNAGVYTKDGGPFPFRVSKWANESKEHYDVAVKCEIVSNDPKVSGRVVYTNMPLRTAIDADRGNTSGVAAAYKAMAGEPIRGVSEKEHAKQFVELLQTEPMVKFRVQNALRDQDAEKAYGEKKKAGTLTPADVNPKAVYGQKKIASLPGGSDGKGGFTGAADHPVTKTRCVARPHPVEFKPTTDTQETK